MKIRNIFCTALLALSLPGAHAEEKPKTSEHRPKLILAIAIDQFRYDYTTRFRDRYTGGLATMLSQGAVFVDAHQDHFPTVTATGHATFLTGSVPATSGIIGNDWYDRALGKTITSVEDAKTTLLGAGSGKEGASPHNLIVSTLGDEIKIADRGTSKVIGISMKDRAAILPAGRMADAAYWIDNQSGNVVSSTWYQSKLPEWVEQFNSTKPALKYLGATWFPIGKDAFSAKPFITLSNIANKAYFSEWEKTPYANDMLEELAEQVLRHEDLGHHNGTDVLTISFSANDHLGHAVGPDAPEVEDMSVYTDRVLAKLLDAAVKQAGGLENLLVVVTADHGVSPVPEVNTARKMPGGRIDKKEYLGKIQDALTKKFGEGKWLLGVQESGFYFNYDLIAQKKLKPSAVEDEAAAAAMTLPYVARTYTRTQLLKHEAAQSQIDEYVARAFFPQRGPDVIVIMKPYYLGGDSGTGHGSPYDYDSHVPLIFYGSKVRAGVYSKRVGVSDVAPTLAAILQIETPSGNVGHVLEQVAEPFLESRQQSHLPHSTPKHSAKQ
ncbi:alkaline phosphatase family protein [Granulicella sp. WH15]|uniref:alkaline phosphatase family protein n=1 Tax=Granulicella sp. WH15 TaxID=2602070 RepID=UPI001367658F|nr:alkaline phosphatase family protein [Granulicella sp. WH15]QHN02594.1 alkaline phosphatase family protein [Granulicella sp. WH15]